MAGRPTLGLRVASAVLAVLAATAVARLTAVNASTTGFLFLMVVWFATTWGGLTVGVCASVAAAVCFSAFFLPPVGTSHIADPDNWVALATFLGASALANRLVTGARAQAGRAEARAREVEAVNALTVKLLAAEHDLLSMGRLAGEALLATGARAAGLILYEGAAARPQAWCGEDCPPYALELGRRVRDSVQMVELEGEPERDIFVPLLVRGQSMGVLACIGTRAARSAVESVAKVLTLALERQELLRERAHIQALRESEALKTALLRAVSHDLSTPLTAIGFQIDALKRLVAGHEALANVGELEAEASRLRRRIEDLLALGRLEAGNVVPRPEPVPPADLFRSARESLSLLRRPLHLRIDEDCPEIFADPSLALEIVVNLLENADRASAEGVPVELVASAADGNVLLGVLDRGRGIPQVPPGREIEASDVLPRGLGLEIAQRFAAASGGSVRLESRPGGGVAAWVHLPAAPVAARP